MQRDGKYMLDILEAAKLAIKYTDETTREEFFGNTTKSGCSNPAH